MKPLSLLLCLGFFIVQLIFIIQRWLAFETEVIVENPHKWSVPNVAVSFEKTQINKVLNTSSIGLNTSNTIEFLKNNVAITIILEKRTNHFASSVEMDISHYHLLFTNFIQNGTQIKIRGSSSYEIFLTFVNETYLKWAEVSFLSSAFDLHCSRHHRVMAEETLFTLQRLRYILLKPPYPTQCKIYDKDGSQCECFRQCVTRMLLKRQINSSKLAQKWSLIFNYYAVSVVCKEKCRSMDCDHEEFAAQTSVSYLKKKEVVSIDIKSSQIIRVVPSLSSIEVWAYIAGIASFWFTFSVFEGCKKTFELLASHLRGYHQKIRRHKGRQLDTHIVFSDQDSQQRQQRSRKFSSILGFTLSLGLFWVMSNIVFYEYIQNVLVCDVGFRNIYQDTIPMINIGLSLEDVINPRALCNCSGPAFRDAVTKMYENVSLSYKDFMTSYFYNLEEMIQCLVFLDNGRENKVLSCEDLAPLSIIFYNRYVYLTFFNRSYTEADKKYNYKRGLHRSLLTYIRINKALNHMVSLQFPGSYPFERLSNETLTFNGTNLNVRVAYNHIQENLEPHQLRSGCEPSPCFKSTGDCYFWCTTRKLRAMYKNETLINWPSEPSGLKRRFDASTEIENEVTSACGAYCEKQQCCTTNTYKPFNYEDDFGLPNHTIITVYQPDPFSVITYVFRLKTTLLDVAVYLCGLVSFTFGVGLLQVSRSLSMNLRKFAIKLTTCHACFMGRFCHTRLTSKFPLLFPLFFVVCSFFSVRQILMVSELYFRRFVIVDYQIVDGEILAPKVMINVKLDSINESVYKGGRGGLHTYFSNNCESQVLRSLTNKGCGDIKVNIHKDEVIVALFRKEISPDDVLLPSRLAQSKLLIRLKIPFKSQKHACLDFMLTPKRGESGGGGSRHDYSTCLKSDYNAFSFSMYIVHLLKAPFYPECVDYRKSMGVASRQHCFTKCHSASFNATKRENITEKCIKLCGKPDCVNDIIKLRQIVKPCDGESLKDGFWFNLFYPERQIVEYHMKPLFTQLDYSVYIGNTLSVWFGISMYSVACSVEIILWSVAKAFKTFIRN